MTDSEKYSFPYTNNARLKIRYLAVERVLGGESRYQVASSLKISRRKVNEWVKAYLAGGLEALALKKAPGRTSRLTEEQREQLKEYVIKNSVKPDGGRLIGEDIRIYIAKTFGVEYRLNHIYYLLNKLDLSWISSRSIHPKQEPERLEAFKKFPR